MNRAKPRAFNNGWSVASHFILNITFKMTGKAKN